MKDSICRILLVPSAGLVMLLLTGGCATQSDLEHVRRSLSADLDTAKSQAQTALRTVHEKLDAERKVMMTLQDRANEQEHKIQTLSSQLAAGHDALTAEMTDLKKVIQEAGTRREADLSRFHRAEEHLSTLSAGAQRFQSFLLDLTGTLVRQNQGEVEALTQRVREMERLAKGLESGSRPPFPNNSEDPHGQP